MAYETIDVRKLTGGCGAEVRGIRRLYAWLDEQKGIFRSGSVHGR